MALPRGDVPATQRDGCTPGCSGDGCGLALYLFNPPVFLVSPSFPQCPELSVPAVKWGFPCCAPSLPVRCRHHLEPSKAGDSAEIKQRLMGSGKDLLRPQRTGFSSPLTVLRASRTAQQDASWDPPGHPPTRAPRNQPFRDLPGHLPVEIPSQLSLHVGNHPGTNRLLVPVPSPSPQHPHGCRHAELLPRQQHAPLSGSGFNHCHPRGGLDTQQNWQRQRDPGGGDETNNQRNQPQKNNASF